MRIQPRSKATSLSINNLATERRVVKYIVFSTLKEADSAGSKEGYYSSVVWRAIFCQVFEVEPENNNDPRWDKLFTKTGYRALSFIRLYERWLRRYRA